jgi:hypothetical protein
MNPRVVRYFLLFLAAAWSGEAAELRLRSSAVCPAPIVRVADVAEIHVADPAVAEALARIPICPAPSAAGQRTITQHDLRQLLLLSGVDFEGLIVTGSEQVAVRLGSGPLVPRAIHSVPGAMALIQPASFARSEAAAGDAGADAPQGRPPIDPSAEPSERPQLVERNAIVTVQARAEGVRVATSGKALADGNLGEIILVELTDTRSKVPAKIIAPQLVEVAVSSRSAAIAPVQP